jgi:AcrR family transcriptional regulator
MAGTSKLEGSLWERVERPARTPLSPQQIAATAVKIADAEGLDAVTMRRIATDLGVAPMAAYRYVNGKDDVINLMIDLAYAESEAPVGEDWRAVLRALAFGTRDLIARHPWLTQLSGSHAAFLLTPNRMTTADRALAALELPGVDADLRMAIFRSLNSYVLGAATSGVALRQAMAGHGWTSGREMRDGLAPEMTYLLGTRRYPAFQRYISEGRRKDDWEWQFELGLDCMLDGIAARIQETPRG